MSQYSGPLVLVAFATLPTQLNLSSSALAGLARVDKTQGMETVKSSKSNGASFKACVDSGGTVKTDSKGNQDCTPKKK
jgi:hypothetical protein